jgi:hypothetical protein
VLEDGFGECDFGVACLHHRRGERDCVQRFELAMAARPADEVAVAFEFCPRLATPGHD